MRQIHGKCLQYMKIEIDMIIAFAFSFVDILYAVCAFSCLEIDIILVSHRMLDKGQMQRHCFHTLGYRTQGVLCSPLYAIVEH